MERSAFSLRTAGVAVLAALILFVILPTMLSGKDGYVHLQPEAPPSPSRSAAPARYTGPQPFDILHYRLDLTLAMVDERFGGTSTITMVLLAPADSLILNEAALTLDSVFVDGVLKAITVSPENETFTINLGQTRSAGDTLRIFIAYRREPMVARQGSRRGYYYFLASSLNPPNPANLGYTMSEPSEARFWMPCYDEPWEKATAEINVTVPSGYTAASNGRLLGVTSNPDSTVTWQWREDHVLATYLMCVTASQFSVPTIPFARGPNDTIPVEYYVWALDSVKTAQYLPTVRQMIEAYSARYGPYPFEKYGMSGVVPFAYGGMEHQSITTLNRFYLTSEAVVAHELAHQWWGDLVTCGTWADIWLNESFATYSEAIWKESLGGPAALRTYMNTRLLHFNFGSWLSAVYDPVGQGQDQFSDLIYSKGAWVLHTLRGVLGDSLFFQSLLAYREKYQGASATTREFNAVVDSVAGRSLKGFFDQWIFSPGWPEYDFSSSYASGSLRLSVSQMQRKGDSSRAAWHVYTMPIQMRAYGAGRDTTFVIQDSLEVQTFSVPLAFAPDSVKLDPDSWILRHVVATPSGEEPTPSSHPSRFALEQNFPNPFNPATTIRYSLPASGVVSLTVYDMLGREVRVLVRTVQSAGAHKVEFNANGLASGVYIYRLTLSARDGQAGTMTTSQKMLLVR